MFDLSSIFIIRNLSKVKDEPDSGEYQGASHKQDPATKSLPIEGSSVSSVKTASKSRESDFERTLCIIYS